MAGLASKTYDPSSKAPFTIEIAKSSSSKCRNPHCPKSRSKILKGELRMARMEISPTEEVNINLRGGLIPKWVHMKCCAPVILREAVNRYGGSIEGVPGFDQLQAAVNERCPDPEGEARVLTQLILGGDDGTNSGTTDSSANAAGVLVEPIDSENQQKPPAKGGKKRAGTTTAFCAKKVRNKGFKKKVMKQSAKK